LVTVEHQGRVLVPAFQFDDTYQPVPTVRDAVHRLTEFGLSGWVVWRWFTAVNPSLNAPPVTLIDEKQSARLSGAVDALVSARDS